jgi:hypothetical protein
MLHRCRHPRFTATFAAISVAAWLATGGAAHAASVSAYDPDSVVIALQGAGYKAKVDRDDHGDPFIETGIGGDDVRIAFVHCDNGRNCDQFELVAVWNCENDIPGCSKVGDAWNKDENFSHALITNGRIALYYHLLSSKEGVSPDLFLANFEQFGQDIAALQKLYVDSFKR